MIVQQLVFYLLAAVAVAAGVLVISARNPVHSVLFLILAFFNGAGLFVLIGAEFLAMMLDINYVRLREGVLQYLPIGALVGLVLLVELILVFGTWALTPETIA